jgi:vacuolar-type H+-ATPase subunit E/Vma4
VTTLAGSRTALEPLVEALLHRARLEAAELVLAAEDDGREAREAARRQVEATVRTAVERGRSEGEAVAAAELAGARRRSRARLLAAQSATHAEVGEAARQVVSEVLDRPGRREQLEAVLRSRLGGTATIHPTADGGLEAVSDDGRSISASVATLAASALDQLDLGEMWTTS